MTRQLTAFSPFSYYTVLSIVPIPGYHTSNNHPKLPYIDPSVTPLEANPADANHHIHAFLLRTSPLVCEGSVLLGVPKCAYSAMHAATAERIGFRRVTWVLDYGAVGNKFVWRLLGFAGCSLLDE
jgi:hypothetical protein